MVMTKAEASAVDHLLRVFLGDDTASITFGELDHLIERVHLKLGTGLTPQELGDRFRDNLARRHEITKLFLAERAEFVSTLRQCTGDTPDYYRWTGHAEARRLLAAQLGLPVAWPAEDAQKDGDAS